MRIDGQAPDNAHALHMDADSNGIVTDARLHQLIRQSGDIEDRHFEIEFLDPSAGALCFTRSVPMEMDGLDEVDFFPTRCSSRASLVTNSVTLGC